MSELSPDFAVLFDLGEIDVWIEAYGKSCYAYLREREKGLVGDCWLFNLVEAPEEFESEYGEPPVPDRNHARPFDLAATIDPEAFLVSGGEFEGRCAYEIWYRRELIGVLSAARGQSQSAFATAPSGLVRPLDRRKALLRHFERTEFHLKRVLESEEHQMPAESVALVREFLGAAEYGLAVEVLGEFEESFSEESRVAMEQIRLVNGVLVP